MNDQNHNLRSRRVTWTFWITGLGSLVWLLLRSGTKPRRLTYPCQRAALVSSLGFVGYLLSLLGTVRLYHRLKQRITLAGVIFFALALLITSGLQSSSAVLPAPVRASPDLPEWTSPSAVSDVFAVSNVPVPQCSLDGGTLPSTPPCNSADYALHDDGVDALVDLMESEGTYFYQTAAHPDGIIGTNDIVVIKINNQWGGYGDGDGRGRLATNTDVLKGLIWRILQHPEGFGGEVVVAENNQDSGTTWNTTPANAQDPAQSFRDVVVAFQSLGYLVSLYNWSSLNDDLLSGGSVGGGHPPDEYINGNMSDAYILLEDPAGTGTDELSYPKFQTTNGNQVSMCYGVWNGSSYDSDRLTFINLPVLKRHGMAGATIAWKNLIGFISTFNNGSRYGGWDLMHDFYWGYTGGPNRDYGLLGRDIALVRAPDLHLVDAIWVGYQDNTSGNASRQDVLLASTDPFAVDWYTSEYVLFPLAGSRSASAARGGTFRSATRTNQNVAESVWPGGSGSYPYIDLLDTYNGNTPTDDEREQMNVYVVSETACEPITDVGITGPTVGFTDTLHTFSAIITPPDATTPITYTWSPPPNAGQGTASTQYQWATPDVYTITLTAENCGGSDTATRAITIVDELIIYLPLILK